MVPPINDFSCISFGIGILWLRILLILLSSPQKNVAPIISKFPLFAFNCKLLKSRLVVIMVTPIRTRATDINPTGFSFSLKNSIANKTEKIISPFTKTELSAAVVCFRPKKNIAGAIAAPEIAVVISSTKSLFSKDSLRFRWS